MLAIHLPNSGALDRQLARACEELALTPDQRQREQLLQYLALLLKWNKAYNLTAITDPEQALRLHIIDSISILPLLEAGNLLDIGAGAGLPGIPVAIMEPERSVTLLDANSKKTRFMRQAIHELGLGNTDVIHSRVEDYQAEAGFDVITCRAFASLPDMISGSKHLLAPQGLWQAMKADGVPDEIANMSDATVRKIESLQVPGLAARRHLVTLAHSG